VIRELTDEHRDELIEQLAAQVAKLGMITPAIFFLEMNRPFTYIGSQAMHFFAPFASIVGFSSLQDLALVFEERANVERLLQRLEELA
jgi:hypothetical protein